MKPMIGKSIDQSMTIDALLVNCHRLASANQWPIDNHTKVVATHRLSSIGVKKFLVCHVPACTYTHSQYARMFEMIRICSNLLEFVCMQLNGFKNQEQKHTLTDFEQFETVFWRNTSQQHTFSLSCSFRCPLYCWYLIDMNFREFYIFTISYFSNRSCPHALQDEIYYLIYPCKFLRIIKCSV